MIRLRQHPVLLTAGLLVIVLVAYSIKVYMNSLSQSGGFGFGGAPVVVTEPARLTLLVDQVEAIGTTHANESVSLTSKVTDTVRKVNFEDGDTVEAGAILVELTKAQETAQLAEAQAALNEAERQLKRIENLIQQGVASEFQLDEQKARQQTAKARLDAILARLDDRLIRAPFSGLLGFRNVSTGTLLSPGTIVTTLDDVSVIKVDFSVPENFLTVLEPGQEIITSSSAWKDKTFTGEVKTINSRIDPVTRSITVRAHIINDEKLLKPGMLLIVTLIKSREEVLVVPEEAVVPAQDRQFVYTVGEDNIVKQLEIKTGRRKPGLVEVLSGLEAGQQVVTQGVIKIRPGSKVIVKGKGSTPDAAF